MSTMIESLKQAFDRAAQLPVEEQAALAEAIREMLDADAKWEELFADPLTPQLLDQLAAEAIADDDAGLIDQLRRGRQGI